MLVEVLNPVQASLIIGPSIGSRLDHPVVRKTRFRNLIREVVGAFDNHERKNAPA